MSAENSTPKAIWIITEETAEQGKRILFPNKN